MKLPQLLCSTASPYTMDWIHIWCKENKMTSKKEKRNCYQQNHVRLFSEVVFFHRVNFRAYLRISSFVHYTTYSHATIHMPSVLSETYEPKVLMCMSIVFNVSPSIFFLNITTLLFFRLRTDSALESEFW